MGDREEPRMLVVEDESDIAAALSKLLRRKFRAQVVVACDAASARRALSASDRFDVVTLDYQLPDGDGLELLAEIIEMPDAPSVVMVTGHGDEEIAATAVRTGVTGYVRKDSRLAELLVDSVEKALLESRLKRGLLEAEELRWQRGILDEIQEAVIATDAGKEFRITFWSKGAERMYGWKAEEVMGRPVLEVIGQPRINAPEDGVLNDIRETGRFGGQTVRFHRDGTRLILETSSVAQVDSHGKTTGYIAVHRQVTEDQDY